jgi:hypothetical protein
VPWDDYQSFNDTLFKINVQIRNKTQPLAVDNINHLFLPQIGSLYHTITPRLFPKMPINYYILVLAAKNVKKKEPIRSILLFIVKQQGAQLVFYKFMV